ncbi:1,4-beta-N-acetylmuramidase, partial [Lacticaseibacillus paracasei]|nr:1,4-beta-N-acetylmuramidase [Lacticaseibacillus paracasei]
MADVSSWQPESDSWFRQLADVGVKTVVVKLTEGTTYRNPKAAAQLAAGRRMGMQVHGYHYAHYHNSADAVAEGRFFGTTAKALGIPTESVMVADVEDPGLTGELTGLTNVFLQTVKVIGYPHTDLYTMASWLTTRRFDRVALIPKNLWLTSYGVNQPGVDNVGTWQFTNNFQGLGVDMSYDFFGHYTTRLTGTLNGGVAR